MSDEQDEESKTEAASERRIRQAYDEGKVAVGRDSVQWAALVAGVLAMMAVSGMFLRSLLAAFHTTAFLAPQAPFAALPPLLLPLVGLTAIIIAAPAIASVVATFAQTKGGTWAHLALPDLTRLWEPSRLTRMFSLEMLVDTMLGAAKVVAVIGSAWSVLRDGLVTLSAMMVAPTSSQLSTLYELLTKAGVRMLTALALLAGVELAVTRFRFSKKMRMTRDEVRREHKEDEGDPLVRSRRKRRHRELVQQNTRAETVRADAVVVNPTHIAIAIRYRRDEGGAPKVIAKGKGALAEVIRDTARENGIPIVQDIPLARLLYRKVKVGRSVPADTYKAVAAILAFVYRVTGRMQGQGAGGER